MWNLRERVELLTCDGATWTSSCPRPASGAGAGGRGNVWEEWAAGKWSSGDKASTVLLPLEHPVLLAVFELPLVTAGRIYHRILGLGNVGSCW
jgi:hypothetical protein